MSAVAEQPAVSPIGPGGPSSTLPGVIRSELTKLRSVRSTKWTIFVLVAVTVGFGVLFCFLTNHYWPKTSESDRADFDPAATSYTGLMFGQLAIAVLGVLAISSEYSTGGIRTSLIAVPNRMRFLAAKIASFSLLAGAAGLVIAFASFFAGQPFFAKRGIGASLHDGSVVRAVFGAALYVVVSGLFGLAVGLLLRHSAGAITVVVAFMFVLPLVVRAFPGDWGKAIVRYFLSNAGQQITFVHQRDNHLGPWMGLFIYCMWALVPLVVGAFLLRRRDA